MIAYPRAEPAEDAVGVLWIGLVAGLFDAVLAGEADEPSRLAVHLQIEYEDATSSHLVSDRSWTWRTLDFSGTDEAGEKQTFALRFKDAEIAQQFKAKYDECRAINAKLDKPAEQ